ncbi:MAG: IS110 family transposase [Candidatus Omnitrophota bacterium]|jgi:transposase
MNYLGIDVSKSTSRYVFLDSDGEKLAKSFTLQNHQQDFTKLLERLKELNLSADNLLIGIEATGIWWENLYCLLTENKFKVIVLNPHQTNKFREALRIKAKTDDLDAYVIAGLLRSQEYASSFIPEESIQILREITKLRFQLLKDRQDYERQASALLGLLFPEYPQTALKNPFTVSSMAILKMFPTAKHLAEAKPKNIEKIVRSIQGNNFNIDEIQSLIDTARKSIYSGRAKHDRGLNLNILLTQIETLQHAIAQLDQRMNDILSPSDSDDANSFPGANLLTIPGVGPKTLAAILSAVGSNGQAFAEGKHLIGYVGFFPRIYESGETRRDNKISTRGPKYLRWALYMAAVACLKHNREFKALYNRKISQGKSAKQALIYVAKKLAHLCLSMLKSGESYNPARVFMPV